MSPTPRHGTPEGDATIAIRNLARRTRADVQDLMTLYALEGLLARLAVSQYRDDFILKGGVLLAAFAARRPTKDIDLQATRLSGEPDEVAQRVRGIAAINLADGLQFDPDSAIATTIRDEDEYAGVRVRLNTRLGTARLAIGLDVSFGDPIWPAPQTYHLPRIVAIGLPPVTVLGYPLTMVIAEKVVTAIDRGLANTRWRDFADLYAISRLHAMDANELSTSVSAVANWRGVTPTTLLPRLEQMGRQAQPRWRSWRTRSHRSDEIPASFTDVLSAIAAFADPVLAGTADGSWNPTAQAWQR